jgi:histidine ammonia-lyase
MECIDNVKKILAGELLCAAQALDFHRPLAPAPATGAVWRAIRERVPFVERDRPVAPLWERVVDLVEAGEIVGRVRAVLGEGWFEAEAA